MTAINQRDGIVRKSAQRRHILPAKQRTRHERVQRTRTADVRSDTDVDCCVLSAATFARLEQDRPSLATRLLHNLLRSTTETAGRLTAEVAALES